MRYIRQVIIECYYKLYILFSTGVYPCEHNKSYHYIIINWMVYYSDVRLLIYLIKLYKISDNVLNSILRECIYYHRANVFKSIVSNFKPPIDDLTMSNSILSKNMEIIECIFYNYYRNEKNQSLNDWLNQYRVNIIIENIYNIAIIGNR